jgi:hypothetical protein
MNETKTIGILCVATFALSLFLILMLGVKDRQLTDDIKVLQAELKNATNEVRIIISNVTILTGIVNDQRKMIKDLSKMVEYSMPAIPDAPLSPIPPQPDIALVPDDPTPGPVGQR